MKMSGRDVQGKVRGNGQIPKYPRVAAMICDILINTHTETDNF